jgi:hypothetical protein
MSADPSQLQQAKMKEFMSLLPLTLELAGLPKATSGQFFTEGQMDIRVNIVRNAYKLARQLVIDIAKPPEQERAE